MNHLFLCSKKKKKKCLMLKITWHVTEVNREQLFISATNQ